MTVHVLGTQPKKVAVVGCGPTMHDYTSLVASSEGEVFSVDEVWGVNGAGAALHVDLNFIIDDVLFSQANSALFERVKGPVITSVARSDGHHHYPLAEVLKIPGAREYLNHTGAYIIAYAIITGVREICVFGCDYVSEAMPYSHTSNNATTPARYMACMAYWLGIAAARGIDVIPSPNSPLLDSDTSKLSKFYGYLVPPIVKREGE